MANPNDSKFSFSYSSGYVDFYGDYASDSSISASASGELNLVVAGTRISTTAAALTIESNLSSSAVRTPVATLSVSSNANLSAVSFKFAYAFVDDTTLIYNADLQATALKFAYAISDLSGSGSFQATSSKIAYLQSQLLHSSNVSVAAIKILLAKIDISGMSLTVAVGKEVVFGKSEISIVSSSPFSRTIPGTSLLSGEARLIVGATRFSPSIVEDVQIIRTLVSIDGKPLSEHNRQFQSAVVQSFIENVNWNSSRSRYYKNSGGRRSFSLRWSMLPSSREQTVDLRFGRDKIKEIASDPDIHTLKILNLDSDGTTPYTETEYNVLVKNYTESLVRRDINNDSYFWDCSLELEEV